MWGYPIGQLEGLVSSWATLPKRAWHIKGEEGFQDCTDQKANNDALSNPGPATLGRYFPVISTSGSTCVRCLHLGEQTENFSYWSSTKHEEFEASNR